VYRCQAAYFDGRLYCSSADDFLYEFRFVNARLVEEPISHTANKFVYPGAAPSISADSSRNAIVWAAENGGGEQQGPAVLRAYDANDLARELYDSNEAPADRDHFGTGNKFITPMIAHGKVYVGTTDGVGYSGYSGIPDRRPLAGKILRISLRILHNSPCANCATASP
jgi:hypothetical protein